MSVQSTTPPDSPSLLAVVSSIMDFPAPAWPPRGLRQTGRAAGRTLPLQHFAMLGLVDGGLRWRHEYQLPETFKQQLAREEPRLTEQLTRLDEGQGWCVQPVEHIEVQWLLARTAPEQTPTLRLLLECLAKRLHETQTGIQLAGQASPLMQRDPYWQQKIEKIGRIMRLAHNLPQHACLPSWRRCCARCSRSATCC